MAGRKVLPNEDVAMTSRERVLLTIEHREPDRVPLTFRGYRSHHKALLEHFGTDDLAVVMRQLGVDGLGQFGFRGIAPTYLEEDGRRRQDTSPPVVFERCDRLSMKPLRVLETAAEVGHYHWPEMSWFDFSDLWYDNEEKIAADYAAHRDYRWPEPDWENDPISAGWSNVLLVLCGLRGYEPFLTDLVLRPRLSQALVSRMFDFMLEYNCHLLAAADKPLQIFTIGDDYGTQKGLYVSPELFRKFFLPGLRQEFRLGKALGLKVFLHSCGSIREIIPDLIEAGLDVLDPIQVGAAGMDPEELKREFGRDLCFSGAVDVQETMCHGTPDQVREEVKARLEVLAPGGGYILTTSHIMPAETPLENIPALFEAALQYGVY